MEPDYRPSSHRGCVPIKKHADMAITSRMLWMICPSVRCRARDRYREDVRGEVRSKVERPGFPTALARSSLLLLNEISHTGIDSYISLAMPPAPDRCAQTESLAADYYRSIPVCHVASNRLFGAVARRRALIRTKHAAIGAVLMLGSILYSR